MWYGDKVRVRLDVDLTRYHRNLVPGALGWLIPNIYTDVWAKTYDRFGVVDWDDAPARDIVIANLTFLKEGDENAKAKGSEKAKAPATVTNARFDGETLRYSLTEDDGSVKHMTQTDPTVIRLLSKNLAKQGIQITKPEPEPEPTPFKVEWGFDEGKPKK